jgi:DNA mismatch repair ATPase MutS
LMVLRILSSFNTRSIAILPELGSGNLASDGFGC